VILLFVRAEIWEEYETIWDAGMKNDGIPKHPGDGISLRNAQ